MLLPSDRVRLLASTVTIPGRVFELVLFPILLPPAISISVAVTVIWPPEPREVMGEASLGMGIWPPKPGILGETSKPGILGETSLMMPLSSERARALAWS